MLEVINDSDEGGKKIKKMGSLFNRGDKGCFLRRGKDGK